MIRSLYRFSLVGEREKYISYSLFQPFLSRNEREREEERERGREREGYNKRERERFEDNCRRYERGDVVWKPVVGFTQRIRKGYANCVSLAYFLLISCVFLA